MRLFSDQEHEIFEANWVSKNVNHQYSNLMNDDEYINYKIWEDLNWREMYKKHLPGTIVFKGCNPNIIFHGRCLGCLSQRKFGIDRCKQCFYFRFDSSKPNLFIEGEESAKLSGDDIKNILGSI